MLNVVPSQEDAFESAFGEARALIAAAHGFISLELQRCVETPNRYVLLVRWRELADHTDGFRKSLQYQRWREMLHHFYDPFPVVEHFESVFTG